MIRMDPTQKLSEKSMREDFDAIDTNKDGTVNMQGILFY